jgi:hypothetical protein
MKDRLELFKLAAHPAADPVAELEHAGVADRVAGVFPPLGPADHPCGVQYPQVLAEVLL